MSFENVLASPFPQARPSWSDRRLDEALHRRRRYDRQNPPSEVYVYVGEKQATGNPVERAGLTGGDLFGVKVPGDPTEATVNGGEHFDSSP